MNVTGQTLDVRQHIMDTAQPIISGKGFSAVGLNEILAASGVPKGSFYHYFSSKEAFGEALLGCYFSKYLEELDTLLEKPGFSGAERLMSYWQKWLETQAACDPQGKCLAVKLGAEVSDLSEAMRGALLSGTAKIIKRLTRAVEAGMEDGSLVVEGDPSRVAETLYQMWLGASLLAKITRDRKPLNAALAATYGLLRLEEPAVERPQF